MTPAVAMEAALACSFWFAVGIKVGRDSARRAARARRLQAQRAALEQPLRFGP